MTLVGTDVRRSEDRPLLTGRATFVGDLHREGQLWARVVRSYSPHALLRGVDTTAARAAPGVVDVITAADVPDARIPIRLPFADTPQAALALQPLLARERVRFVGEAVAVVVAEDPYVAEDAAELVVLDLEELPPVADARTAVVAPALHAELGGNVVNVFP
ncbi:MAG TPA: hypothetical protein VFY02_12355, partial [Gaiellaceae bacterium]|nr:hypothetical protein [Gaiellaceae bacterium]